MIDTQQMQAAKRGRPQRSDKKISKHRVMLRPVLWDAIEAAANESGLTVNRVIELCLAKQLDVDVN